MQKVFENDLKINEWNRPPSYHTRKQLPEARRDLIKVQNPHDDKLLSENEKKLSKEHSEEKEALIIAYVLLIIAGMYFFK